MSVRTESIVGRSFGSGTGACSLPLDSEKGADLEGGMIGMCSLPAVCNTKMISSVEGNDDISLGVIKKCQKIKG